MNMISAIAQCGCDTVADDLRAQFGAILADRIIEAEAVDFLWEGRVRERYLGQQLGDFVDEDVSEEVSRVAVLSSIASRWYVGLCLVDGEGNAIELLWKRDFSGWPEAESALERAH